MQRPKFYSVSIVIPCLNEEGNLAPLCENLVSELKHYHDYEIIFVDDGSTDGTLNELKSIQSEKVHYLSFSRNFGHQFALKAGFDHANGDLVIMMDADSEHPPFIIHKLIERWIEGFDIVSTRRKENKNLSFFKRVTSKLYYRTFRFLSDVELSEGSSDFRLIDRKVVEVVKTFDENNIFWRGIFYWLGFRQASISYDQAIRQRGVSKYNFRRMFVLALDGITAFSSKPLHISMIVGSLFAFLAFAYGIYAIYLHVFTSQTVSGWTSTLAGIMFMGGLQLIILGIIGTYLGRLYFESKRRPKYIVSETSLDTQEHIISREAV